VYKQPESAVAIESLTPDDCCWYVDVHGVYITRGISVLRGSSRGRGALAWAKAPTHEWSR